MKAWLKLFVILMMFQMSAWAKGTAQDDARLKIVVIDTQIAESQLTQPYMCKNGSVSANDKYPSWHKDNIENTAELFHHGQNVVGLIAQNMDQKKYCIYHIAYYFFEEANHVDTYKQALIEILKLKHIAGANLSVSSGIASSINGRNYSELSNGYLPIEWIVLNGLVQNDVKVVVAIGNDHKFLTKNDCRSYPACLRLKMKSQAKNFYVVGSSTFYLINGEPHIFSNFSNVLNVHKEDGVEVGTPPMSGTSQSTAIFTGKLFSR